MTNYALDTCIILRVYPIGYMTMSPTVPVKCHFLYPRSCTFDPTQINLLSLKKHGLWTNTIGLPIIAVNPGNCTKIPQHIPDTPISKDRSYRRPTVQMFLSFAMTWNGCHSQTHHRKWFSANPASSLRAGFNFLKPILVMWMMKPYVLKMALSGHRCVCRYKLNADG